ncbi:DUF4252 domain-containing protein [candidate division KSB1 bacterium]|nr:DUF4252 domain-containing protein [candidate division KSB1 bacterium]
MKSHILVTTAALVILFAITGITQDFDVINHPGYVNLDDIDIPDDALNVTEVSIGPEILQMVNMFSDEDVPEDAFGGFLNITVKTFDVDSLISGDIRKKMIKLDKKLKREKWSPLVRSRSGGEFTNVSIKYSKDKKKSLGLFIMSLEPGNEASFVNIVGNIDFNQLKDMDIGIKGSALDSLKHVMDDDE